MLDANLRAQLFDLYPVLKKVSAEHLEPALRAANILRYKSGEQMWDETQKFADFPFVIKGSGRIYKLAPNGRELHLYSVGPGDSCVIATGSLMGSSTSTARAVCEKDYEMVCIPVKNFKELVAQSEVFRDYVVSDLTEHLQQLTDMVSAIVFQNLDQRLAASLVAKKSPIQTTHQALADELGSVREIISRMLKNFSDRGWIRLSRGQIDILKPSELKEFSNSL